MSFQGLSRSSQGFSERDSGEGSRAGARTDGAAIGLGEASNCGGEPGLPVLRRESPALEELEVALREDPGRSALGGGIEGVHEWCSETLEDADAMDGADELVGVDCEEVAREDAAVDPPYRM